MRTRNLPALALILAATCLERFAHFGQRTFLVFDLHRAGAATASIGTTVAVLQSLVMLGMLVGGGAALGVGPRAATAAGALLAAGGHLALALGAPIVAGAGAVAVGAGLFRPGVYVAAAEALAWDDDGPAAPGAFRIAAVGAFVLAVHGLANVASALAAPIGGVLRDGHPSLLAYVDGAAMLLATALAAGAAAIVAGTRRAAATGAPIAGPYRAPQAEAARPAAPVGPALAGAAILLVPQVLAAAVATATPAPRELLSGADRMWVYAVQPITSFLASIFVFALLASAAAQRSARPPLLVHAVGLLVSSGALALIAFAGSSSVALYAAGVGLAGIADAAVLTVPLAYVAVAVRGRAAALVVAGWLVIPSIARGVAAAAFGLMEAPREAWLWGGAVLSAAAGAALLGYGRALHNACFDPPVAGE